ncbi:hypothetical protein HPB47_023781 [Ixodes persulcatus]|uniref:Uncharacterized protein n=1 Tax=Ixodes persulcatus TaxID=34615 RepID=A0AC60Q619_IXOPE|nr:hypothetical protein HPB47_023781 [Ixodes persulcatus]
MDVSGTPCGPLAVMGDPFQRGGGGGGGGRKIYGANGEATDDSNDAQPKELTELLDNQDDAVIARHLPPHRRCAAHTLNLVATEGALHMK